MMTKTLIGLVAVLVVAAGVTGGGLYLANTQNTPKANECCVPGAACCDPAGDCCVTGSCCTAPSECCYPGAACCEAQATNAKTEVKAKKSCCESGKCSHE